MRFGTIRKVWLRGVDLFPSPALIPRKLLIRRYAKLAQLAKKAILFLHFFYTFRFEPARLFHATAAPTLRFPYALKQCR